jgi:hypothetical protein
MKPATNVKLEIIDLDEIPEKIDISICLPPKKAPEATKTVQKKDSKTIQLF